MPRAHQSYGARAHSGNTAGRVQLYTEADLEFDTAGTAGTIEESYWSDVETSGSQGEFWITPAAGGVATPTLSDAAAVSWIARDNFGRQITYDNLEYYGLNTVEKLKIYLECVDNSTDAARVAIIVGGAPITTASFADCVAVARHKGVGWRASSGVLVYWNKGTTTIGTTSGSSVSPDSVAHAKALWTAHAKTASGYLYTNNTDVEVVKRLASDGTLQRNQSWHATNSFTALQSTGDALWIHAIVLKEGACAGGSPFKIRVKSDIQLSHKEFTTRPNSEGY